MPTLVLEVVTQRTNTYEGKHGTVTQQIASLVDKSKDAHRLTHTVDLVLPEGVEAYAPLRDRRLTVGVTGLAEWMGAIRVTGEIVEIDGKPVKFSANGESKNGKADSVATESAKK